jgi:hypothetical protein
MKAPKRACPVCGRAGKRGSDYCSEEHKKEHAYKILKTPTHCPYCRFWYEAEDFIGQQGQSVKCCVRCRAHSKDIRVKARVRMAKLMKKPNQYQRQLYSLEQCPWESGEITQIPYGGII